MYDLPSDGKEYRPTDKTCEDIQSNNINWSHYYYFSAPTTADVSNNIQLYTIRTSYVLIRYIITADTYEHSQQNPTDKYRSKASSCSPCTIQDASLLKPTLMLLNYYYYYCRLHAKSYRVHAPNEGGLSRNSLRRSSRGSR